jgi:ribosomal protein L35
MPKIKTHKATRKRFWFTKKGKILARQAGQDHFNARQNGEKIMGKRKDRKVAKENIKAIKKLITNY